MKNNHQHTKRKSVTASSKQTPVSKQKSLVFKLIIGWLAGAFAGVFLVGLYILMDVFVIKSCQEEDDSTFEPVIEAVGQPDVPCQSQEAAFTDSLSGQQVEPAPEPAPTPEPVRPAAHESSISRAYNKGYEKGFDDGEMDSNLHYGWHSSYDDDCSYTGKKRADYVEGYDDGYGDGYDAGIEGDDTEESLELEW